MILNGNLPRAALHVADAVSVGTLVATISSMLPTVAALLTIIWTLLRIYETDTVQALLARWRRNGANK